MRDQSAPEQPSSALDRLYALLPAVIRRRDAEQGEPLRALLRVIASQYNLLEHDLERLYDNWFVETCEPWVLPYIADLIGHQPIRNAGAPGPGPEAFTRNAVLLPRREVAQTLGYRSRKGTLALLEQLARDIAGWPARALEFGPLMMQAQSLRLPHPARGRSVDLRDGAALRRLGGPFDTLAHLPDLRRLASARTPGHYAPAGVGVFVWRLKAYSVTRAPTRCLEEVGPHCHTFSVLGNDAPLFNRPRPRASGAAAATLPALPHAIDRADFAAPRASGAPFATAATDYYGLAKDADRPGVAQSVAVWAPGWPGQPGDAGQPIPASRVIAADLDGWVYQPPPGHVAVDPVRGRIAFPPRQPPRRTVWVSYHYGFSADIGGGEYSRPLQQHAGAEVIRVIGTEALRAALAPWVGVADAAGQLHAPPGQPEHAVIELGDSGVYVLPVRICLGTGHSLQLRAAQCARPVLRLLDCQVDQPDNMVVEGESGSRFTLDGLMIAGRGIQVGGALASFTVRHSTLVPGWSLEPDCDPTRPAEPSIDLLDSDACVVIEHSIVGSIQVNNDEVQTEPIQLHITDSVVDATGADCDRPECEAVGGAGARLAFAVAHIARSTIIGRVRAHAIARADDSLFMGQVMVARRQLGCMRFCYVAPCSRTPRRFQCQPDLVERDAARAGRAAGASDADIAATQEEERLRVRPRFDSVRYGTATYCRLALACAPEIAGGAEDESGMGVFHDLYQPQRLANLRQRLDEFSPAGADAGILFAD